MELKHLKIGKTIFLSSILIFLLLTLFYVPEINKVRSDTEDSGFNFFTDAIDISIGGILAYNNVDVSAHVPEGSTGVILEMINVGGSYGGYSVRMDGSTDDFYDQDSLYPHGHIYVLIGLSEEAIFEMKIKTTDCDAYLLGYTDESVYFYENAIDYNLGIITSWEDIDLSADVPEGSTGVIINAFTTTTNFGGVRHPDSTDTFFKRQYGLMSLLCGVNSSRMIQGYIGHFDFDHWLIGYTSAPITFNVNWDDVSIDATGSFTDVTVTDETTEGCNGVIIYIKSTNAGIFKGTIRENGATDDRSTDSEIISDGCGFGLSPLGAGEIFEGYIEHIAVDFFVVGYIDSSPDNSVYPDHVEDSYLVTNATDTLLNDGVYAEIGTGGWLIWDYNESVANITRINWDIVHNRDGGMWRIEGSNDASTWVILAQMERCSDSVPSPTIKNTRYDSETHARYRYIRLTAIKGVSEDWYLDCVWLNVQPPAIIYEDEEYVYPSVLEYWNWEIFGASPVLTSYASRPFNMLGDNMSNINEDVLIWNSTTTLVNADYDADNRAVVKFSDYYNITSAYVHAQSTRSNMHFYLYMATAPSGNWTLVGDWSGLQSMNYYGANITGTRIRYLMVNCTGLSDNYMNIESFRIEGIVHTGAGVGPTVGEFSFILLPNYLGDLLGIGLEGGQFLSSLIVMSAFLLPIAIYDRKGIVAMIIGVAVFGFLVLIGWLPQWIMLIMILLVAGIYAFNFSGWFGGRR